MKKFVAGLIVGAAIMVSAQAFGASINYQGKKVDGQMNVKVDGAVIGQAVIIQGKSFAPVREITEGLGGKVVSTTGGVISLGANEDTASDKLSTSSTAEINVKIADQKAVVNRVSNMVESLQIKVDNLIAQGIEPSTQKIELNLMSKELEKQVQKLADLERLLEEAE